jgi:hypothetical protein
MSSFSPDQDFDIDLTSVETPHKIQPPGPIRKLLTPTDTPDEYILALDWTTLSNYLDCSKKGEYNFIFSRNDGGSAALVYGSAVHKALEHHYRQKARGLPPCMATVIEEVEAEFSRQPPPLNEWRTPERAIETYIQYIEKYCNEPYQVIGTPEQPFVEQPFSFTLCALDLDTTVPYDKSLVVFDWPESSDQTLYIKRLIINWTGVIDLGLISLQGDLWLVDHKTASIAGPAYFKAFSNAGQFLGYAEAFRHLTGEAPRGVMGNFLIGRKPTIKAKGNPLSLERQHYEYPLWKLENWRRTVFSQIEKLIHDFTTGVFAENSTACNGKYGLCRYFEVCQADPTTSARLSHLMSDSFVYNVWNPLDR